MHWCCRAWVRRMECKLYRLPVIYCLALKPFDMLDLKLVTTVFADVLAPGGARPSTNTVLTTKFGMHYCDVTMGAIASQITSLRLFAQPFIFRRRSKKTSKLRVTGLCAGNSSVTGEFPAQKTSNAENVSIWWRRHGFTKLSLITADFEYVFCSTADEVT